MSFFTDLRFKILSANETSGYGVLEVHFASQNERDHFVRNFSATTIVLDNDDDDTLYVDFNALAHTIETIALIKLPLQEAFLPDSVKETVISKMKAHYPNAWNYQQAIQTQWIEGMPARLYSQGILAHVERKAVASDRQVRQSSLPSAKNRFPYPVILSSLVIALAAYSLGFGILGILFGALMPVAAWGGIQVRNGAYKIFMHQHAFALSTVDENKAFKHGERAAAHLWDYLTSFVEPVAWRHLEAYGAGFFSAYQKSAVSQPNIRPRPKKD